jgi:hypothetical protein
MLGSHKKRRTFFAIGEKGSEGLREEEKRIRPTSLLSLWLKIENAFEFPLW